MIVKLLLIFKVTEADIGYTRDLADRLVKDLTDDAIDCTFVDGKTTLEDCVVEGIYNDHGGVLK